MSNKQFRLSEDAAPHYHDGESVGTEPFTPTDTELEMLGDLLVPVRGNGDDGSNESEGEPETTDNGTDNGTDTDNGTGTGNGDDLTALDGVGPSTAETLREAGYGSFAALDDATVEDLAGVDGVSRSLADGIHDQLVGSASGGG